MLNKIYQIFSIKSYRYFVLLGIVILTTILTCKVFSKDNRLQVTISNHIVGRTPSVVGYNVAHFYPNSNTADWWKYSGVNGARLWSSPNIVEPPHEDDLKPWGDSVYTQADFLARRAALRINPLNNDYINWQYFQDKFQNATTSGNILKIHYAAKSLAKLNVITLAVIQRRIDSYPWSLNKSYKWQTRWEFWQHYYAQAFYLASNFGIERFQIYNEPNHSQANSLKKSDYLQMLKLASDAIVSAVEDVNTIYHTSLQSKVYAPVTAGGSQLDDEEWGKYVLENIKQPIFDDKNTSYDLFQTFDYHQYNGTGQRFAEELKKVKSTMGEILGEPLPVSISEFNVYSNRRFAKTSETMNSPSVVKSLGSILCQMTNEQLDEMYLFKFGQTANYSSKGAIKKNGAYYVSNTSSPYNVTGVTKAGEVYRLFAKGFSQSLELYQKPTITEDTNDCLVASRDKTADENYVMATNMNEDSPLNLNINLSNWGILPKTQIVVEQVSEYYHGEVSDIISVPDSGIISVHQDPSSVILLSIPSHLYPFEYKLKTTKDATVQVGVSENKNYGKKTSLLVGHDPLNLDFRRVTLVKFNLETVDSDTIEEAILSFHGFNQGSQNNILVHIYGVFDSIWNENSIPWNTLNLDDLSQINGMTNNLVEDVSKKVMFVGNLTGWSEEREMMIDVTQFLKEPINYSTITFVITCEDNYNGEVNQTGQLNLRSKEYKNGVFAPTLTLFSDKNLNISNRNFGK